MVAREIQKPRTVAEDSDFGSSGVIPVSHHRHVPALPEANDIGLDQLVVPGEINEPRPIAEDPRFIGHSAIPIPQNRRVTRRPPAKNFTTGHLCIPVHVRQPDSAFKYAEVRPWMTA